MLPGKLQKSVLHIDSSIKESNEFFQEQTAMLEEINASMEEINAETVLLAEMSSPMEYRAEAS